jgi:hypothetical protein
MNCGNSVELNQKIKVYGYKQILALLEKVVYKKIPSQSWGF